MRFTYLRFRLFSLEFQRHRPLANKNRATTSLLFRIRETAALNRSLFVRTYFDVIILSERSLFRGVSMAHRRVPAAQLSSISHGNNKMDDVRNKGLGVYL